MLIVISETYFYFTEDDRRNYKFTLAEKSKPNDFNVSVKIYPNKNWGKYRYTLKINFDDLAVDAINYGYTIKEKDTLKTIYGIDEINSLEYLTFSNHYLENKTYLLEIKLRNKNNPNEVFIYNYEIIPKSELK